MSRDLAAEFDAMLGGGGQKAEVDLSSSSKGFAVTRKIAELGTFTTLATQEVSTPSVVIAVLLVDDSGSMRNREKTEGLATGIRVGVEGFKVTEEHGKKVHLLIVGFKGIYYDGLVSECDSEAIIDAYTPDYNSTPLVETALNLAVGTEQLVEIYNNKGINAHVIMMLITDGYPQHDISPSRFLPVITSKPTWIIQSMGIISDDLKASQVEEIFSSMGITDSAPKKPNEIADSLLEMSQSATSF